MNPDSKHSTDDVLGPALLSRLRQLERAAAAADQARVEQKARVHAAQTALAAKEATLIAESEAAERLEIANVFASIDLDGNGTLEQDEVRQVIQYSRARSPSCLPPCSRTQLQL